MIDRDKRLGDEIRCAFATAADGLEGVERMGLALKGLSHALKETVVVAVEITGDPEGVGPWEIARRLIDALEATEARHAN